MCVRHALNGRGQLHVPEFLDIVGEEEILDVDGVFTWWTKVRLSHQRGPCSLIFGWMVELDLVGVPEIAEMIGTVRQYAHRLSREDPRFPKPAVELNRGVRLWKRADIEKWAKATGRTVQDL